MNLNSMQWFDLRTLIFVGMSLLLNVLVVYLWDKKLYQKLGLKKYQGIQRIHLNETPRLGGFIIILSIISFVAYSDPSESILFLKLILLCLIPIIIIGLKEDLFHNVDPAIRLMSLLFAGWLFRAQYTGPYPNLADVPLINKLLILQGGTSLFYILSLTTVANGLNLIDGVNGLCVAVTISILGGLLFLSYRTNDVVILSAVFTVMITLIPFMIMNYPYGKIFLGDMGAYSLGAILSIFTIIFFGRHPEISPWGAALIMIYPVTEVIFSLLRRLIKGISIYQPDIAHLHLKFFYFFSPQPAYKKIANALVAPTLSGLWLFPLLAITFTYHKPFFILFAIILFIFLYYIFYAVVHHAQKNLIKNKKNN